VAQLIRRWRHTDRGMNTASRPPVHSAAAPSDAGVPDSASDAARNPACGHAQTASYRYRASLHSWTVEPEAVFADPSGRRRRIMRRLGLGLAAALAACLGVIAVAVAGGPQAPFTHWAAPPPRATASNHDLGHRVISRSPPVPLPGVGPSPHPTPGRSSSARPRPGGLASSPVPTNPAGRTPPGRSRTPHPHQSSHAP